MYICSVCGRSNPYGHCVECHKLYEQDIRTGHIPPAFKAAPGVDFTFMDWEDVKVEEAKCASLHLSPEEAQERVSIACEFCMIRHRAEAARLSPAQQRKAINERIKKYSTY